MSTEREQQISALVDEALALGGSERLAFVESACAGDPDLLREVRAALDLDELPAEPPGQGAEPTEALFRGPAPSGGSPSPQAPPRTAGQETPRRIGPYRILELLGEGGMGRVFLAEQSKPVERLVALKLMHASLRGTTARARFDAERRTLARLAHPNVGQIFDAGTTPDGFPWFAMERIDGAPVTKYCDERKLSVEARLELMISICHAVEHAHRRQILHRDLKPSNILVTEIDGAATAKIIDFGVAKALDAPPTEATVMGDGVIGTPAYLSPESIEGPSAEVDTRADVYSLGVVLYELLTGDRPFASEGGFAGMVRRILDEEPERPSTRISVTRAAGGSGNGRAAARRMADPADLRRRLRDDLDWVVLKAIAKHPEQRYGSVAELAADLERHLRHEPVEAGPPGAVYRLRKWVRRHRAGAVAAGLVLVSLVGGLVARTIEANRANREAAAAVAAQQQAEAARADAESARDETEQVSDFLVGLFTGASPRETLGQDVSALELLDRGAERVRSDFEGPPRVQARLLERISSVYYSLGNYERSRSLILEALEIRRVRAEEEPLPYAMALRTLGLTFYAGAGDLDKAEEHYQRSLEILEQAFGPEDASLVPVLNSVAVVAARRRELERSISLYRRALAIEEANEGDETRDLTPLLTNLGATYSMAGRHEEAEEYLRRALALAEELNGSEDPSTASALVNLSFSLSEQGRYEESELPLQRALAIRTKILPEGHPQIGAVLQNLGNIREFQGRLEEAADYYRRTLELHEGSLGPEHRVTARSLHALGSVYSQQGDYDRAEPYLRRAFEIRRATMPPGNQRLVETVSALADLLGNTGRTAEAERLKAEWVPAPDGKR